MTCCAANSGVRFVGRDMDEFSTAHEGVQHQRLARLRHLLDGERATTVGRIDAIYRQGDHIVRAPVAEMEREVARSAVAGAPFLGEPAGAVAILPGASLACESGRWLRRAVGEADDRAKRRAVYDVLGGGDDHGRPFEYDRRD
jgi:hypothetical protein